MLWAVWFYHSSWLWRDPPFQGVIIHKRTCSLWVPFDGKCSVLSWKRWLRAYC